LTYSMRTGAFTGSGRPDVAVHVPPGFEAARKPGLVLYFHGWQSCAEAALASDEAPCTSEGDPRPGSALAEQADAARVNAIIVAVELRPEAPTGEPGQMAMPGGARAFLRELLSDKLAEPLGCALDPDGVDRIVVMAHSGGYQAAAAILQAGDLPRVTEVDLLDALYGGQDLFLQWIADEPARFDPRIAARRRFVDLYTCCGGTLAASRAMMDGIRDVLEPLDLAARVADDDSASDLAPGALGGAVVFKRVPSAHADVPRLYVRALLEAAGFSRIDPR
jgi:pimeloyl-ACP methyl ester carboxylesterase